LGAKISLDTGRCTKDSDIGRRIKSEKKGGGWLKESKIIEEYTPLEYALV
jgi:hypothetical protein